MAYMFPLYDAIAETIGTRHMDKVLHSLFAREREAYRADERDYSQRIEEVQARVDHRHAIILELQEFGNHGILNEPLDNL